MFFEDCRASLRNQAIQIVVVDSIERTGFFCRCITVCFVCRQQATLNTAKIGYAFCAVLEFGGFQNQQSFLWNRCSNVFDPLRPAIQIQGNRIKSKGLQTFLLFRIHLGQRTIHGGSHRFPTRIDRAAQRLIERGIKP